MSWIQRRFRERTDRSRRSDQGPVTSSDGAVDLPQRPARSDSVPSRKPGFGKQPILISAGIISVGIDPGLNTLVEIDAQ